MRDTGSVVHGCFFAYLLVIIKFDWLMTKRSNKFLGVGDAPCTFLVWWHRILGPCGAVHPSRKIKKYHDLTAIKIRTPSLIQWFQNLLSQQVVSCVNSSNLVVRTAWQWRADQNSFVEAPNLTSQKLKDCGTSTPIHIIVETRLVISILSIRNISWRYQICKTLHQATASLPPSLPTNTLKLSTRLEAT